MASLKTELASARRHEDVRSQESQRLLDALESSRADLNTSQSRCAAAERLVDEAAHERENLRAQLQRLRSSTASHSPTRRTVHTGYTEARADTEPQSQLQLPGPDALSARVGEAHRASHARTSQPAGAYACAPVCVAASRRRACRQSGRCVKGPAPVQNRAPTIAT